MRADGERARVEVAIIPDEDIAPERERLLGNALPRMLVLNLFYK